MQTKDLSENLNDFSSEVFLFDPNLAVLTLQDVYKKTNTSI